MVHISPSTSQSTYKSKMVSFHLIMFLNFKLELNRKYYFYKKYFKIIILETRISCLDKHAAKQIIKAWDTTKNFMQKSLTGFR